MKSRRYLEIVEFLVGAAESGGVVAAKFAASLGLGFAGGLAQGFGIPVHDWRRHTDNPASYWMGSHKAAEMLGVPRQRLGQLGDKGSVPFVRHRDGVRLYRREQLLTIANARDARWH